jgi:hypothetical protein
MPRLFQYGEGDVIRLNFRYSDYLTHNCDRLPYSHYTDIYENDILSFEILILPPQDGYSFIVKDAKVYWQLCGCATSTISMPHEIHLFRILSSRITLCKWSMST